MNLSKWLVTGASGFIGSHLVEELLRQDQIVRGMDDLSMGSAEFVIDSFRQRANFDFVRGSITDIRECENACAGMDYVLHHAAIISVHNSNSRDIELVNNLGFQNIWHAAERASVKRFVYASSSAVYGDTKKLPCRECDKLAPISEYGWSKLLNEVYVENRHTRRIGLRYFNVYGPRQRAGGGYAAVIPKWISQMRAGEPCTIYGDGTQTRDFVHVSDVVRANILAATTENESALNRVYNIGSGKPTTMNQLFVTLRSRIPSSVRNQYYAPERAGDINHSWADISLANSLLGWTPQVALEDGLDALLSADKA